MDEGRAQVWVRIPEEALGLGSAKECPQWLRPSARGAEVRRHTLLARAGGFLCPYAPPPSSSLLVPLHSHRDGSHCFQSLPMLQRVVLTRHHQLG